MKFRCGLAVVILPCSVFVLPACKERRQTKAGPPPAAGDALQAAGNSLATVAGPSAGSTDPRRLKEELISSLQADLAKSRAAETAQASQDPLRPSPAQLQTRHLAQALSLLLQEDERTDGRFSSWSASAEILTIGSERTSRLATEYLRAMQSHQAEAQRKQAAAVEAAARRAELTVRKISEELSNMKTPREVDAALAEVSSLMQGASGPSDTQLRLFHQFAKAWQEYLIRKDAGENYETLESLNSVEHFTAGIEWMDVPKITAMLHQERESVGVPNKEQFTKTIASLVEQAFAAKKPEDVDTPLAEIKRLGSYRDYLPDRGRSQASQARQVMQNIQTALSARDSGDAKKLRDFRERVTMNPESDELPLLRSRYLLLARQFEQSLSSNPKPINPANTPAAAAARMTSLESIMLNLPALKLAVDSDASMSTTSVWHTDLMRLEITARQAEQLKAGRGMQRAVHENSLGMTSVPAIAELQRQYDILCLDIAFATEANLPAADGETTRSYVSRLKARLAAQGKWETLQALYTATRAVRMTEPVMTFDDDAVVSGYLYGLRLQTEAKDPRMATCAYQSVLSGSSQLVPAELVGQRLEEIRRSNPQAYSQGSAMSLNISRGEGKRAPGERPEALVWIIPARKPSGTP